jgi:hypothetical protein
MVGMSAQCTVHGAQVGVRIVGREKFVQANASANGGASVWRAVQSAMRRIAVWISRVYILLVRKVLVSLPETDLRVIDEAARKAGETRSSFLRRAAVAEARRTARPIDDPKTRRAFSSLISRAERRKPLSTRDALAARDRGRR